MKIFFLIRLLSNQFRTNFEPISKILKSLQRLIDDSGRPNTVSWTKLWTKFHRYRQEDLLTAWQTISDMFAVELDPILSQSTAERLLLKLVRDVSSHPTESPIIPTRDLSAMEECAVIYCGGFVIHRLLKYFKGDHHRSASAFVEVLKTMCEEDIYDVESENFQEYVKKWIITVNRGGLKLLKEAAFDFFKLLKNTVYTLIASHISKEKVNNKDTVVRNVNGCKCAIFMVYVSSGY